MPYAVMAHIVSLIACDNDNGIFREAGIVQKRQNPSDIPIHTVDAGVILTRHAVDTIDIKVWKLRIRDFNIAFFPGAQIVRHYENYVG